MSAVIICSGRNVHHGDEQTHVGVIRMCGVEATLSRREEGFGRSCDRHGFFAGIESNGGTVLDPPRTEESAVFQLRQVVVQDCDEGVTLPLEIWFYCIGGKREVIREGVSRHVDLASG